VVVVNLRVFDFPVIWWSLMLIDGGRGRNWEGKEERLGVNLKLFDEPVCVLESGGFVSWTKSFQVDAWSEQVSSGEKKRGRPPSPQKVRQRLVVDSLTCPSMSQAPVNLTLRRPQKKGGGGYPRRYRDGIGHLFGRTKC